MGLLVVAFCIYLGTRSRHWAQALGGAVLGWLLVLGLSRIDQTIIVFEAGAVRFINGGPAWLWTQVAIAFVGALVWTMIPFGIATLYRWRRRVRVRTVIRRRAAAEAQARQLAR